MSGSVRRLLGRQSDKRTRNASHNGAPIVCGGKPASYNLNIRNWLWLPTTGFSTPCPNTKQKRSGIRTEDQTTTTIASPFRADVASRMPTVYPPCLCPAVPAGQLAYQYAQKQQTQNCSVSVQVCPRNSRHTTVACLIETLNGRKFYVMSSCDSTIFFFAARSRVVSCGLSREISSYSRT